MKNKGQKGFQSNVTEIFGNTAIMKNKEDSQRLKFAQRFGKPIEEYQSYKKALTDLRPSTKTNYVNHLPEYFLYLDEDPDAVIQNRKTDLQNLDDEQAERYDRKTHSYIKHLLNDKHYTGRSASGILGVIQGFFKNNAKRYALDIKHINYPKTRKVKKYSPTNEEVRHLYTAADNSRNRLIIALMYQNGPDPVDIASLTCSDIPLEPFKYFEKSRSKTGEIWRAVTTPDITYELVSYLKIRGTYEPSDPLFVGREGPCDNRSISEILTVLIEKADLDGKPGFKPTALRDAFEDALVDANVNPKIKASLMGHTGDIEHEYGGQNRLEVACVEAMKKAYPFLSLNDTGRVSSPVAVFTPGELEKLNMVLGRYDEIMAAIEYVKKLSKGEKKT
jgi:integrase